MSREADLIAANDHSGWRRVLTKGFILKSDYLYEYCSRICIAPKGVFYCRRRQSSTVNQVCVDR